MLKLFLYYVGIISFSLATYVHEPTGWTFDQSTLQSFYIFMDINIDGEVAVGDGQHPNACDESYCCENPYSCDVVGAFYNDVCVGWIYTDSTGETTVPANGNDGGPDTGSYPQSGDFIYFRLYDASEDRILHFDSDLSVPDSVTCMNPSSGESGDCTWSNNGIYICSSFMLDNEPLPEQYSLLSSYPNPFNPSLNIDFFAQYSGNISIQVYDLSGKLVEELLSNEFKAFGNHTIIWSPNNLTSGEYIIRLSVNGNQIATQKVAYIK